MNKVMVTGGSGFIGTNLIDYLLGIGLEVTSVDIKVPQNCMHYDVFRQLDILNSDALIQAVIEFRPTLVIHMAARTDFIGASLQDYEVNYAGVHSLMDVLSKCNSVERCIFVSSKLVCRTGYQPHSWDDYNPDTIYGQSKAEGEKIIRRRDALKFEWLIVRPTSIWGPWFNIPYKPFFLSIAKGHYFHPGRMNPPKSYGYIGNVVFQIIKLLEAPREAIHGRTFYLSDYEQCTIRDWANMISMQLHGREARTIPESIMRVVAWGGDILQRIGWKNFPLTSFRLNNMRADTNIGVSMTPTEELCGPLPYSMEQGVEETVAWLREQKLIA